MSIEAMKSATIERARKAAQSLRQRNQVTWDLIDRETVFAIDALVAKAEVLQAQKQETDEVGTGCECPNCANGMGICHTIEEQAQKQEPVAWMYPDDLKRFETSETFAQAYSIEMVSPTQGETVPLFTFPPQRQPLTDEVTQIAEALRRHGLTLVKTAKGYDVMNLGQITAHGIKE